MLSAEDLRARVGDQVWAQLPDAKPKACPAAGAGSPMPSSSPSAMLANLRNAMLANLRNREAAPATSPGSSSPELIASVERMEAPPAASQVPNRHQRRSSKFPRRRSQRSPDRQRSYERRHRLAYSGPMPPQLATRFTVGTLACLRIVGDEHRSKGLCDMSLDEIAARAGVCRKTAKRALLYARGRDDQGRIVGDPLIEIEVRPRPGQRHLTNVVRIVSKEWLTWLARGRPGGGGHLRPPTDTSTETEMIPAAAVARARACVSPNSGEGEEGNNEAVGEESVSEGGGGPNKKAVAERSAAAPGLPSQLAIAFANELVTIAGFKLDRVPQSWTDANPARVVQRWLDQIGEEAAYVGDTPLKWLRRICTMVMKRKPPGPLYSPRYFSPAFNEVVDRIERGKTRPLPMCPPANKRSSAGAGRAAA
jgi:hypothetical protein